MSINTCKCGEVYDSDVKMGSIDGVLVCDKCYQDRVEMESIFESEHSDWGCRD